MQVQYWRSYTLICVSMKWIGLAIHATNIVLFAKSIVFNAHIIISQQQ